MLLLGVLWSAAPTLAVAAGAALADRRHLGARARADRAIERWRAWRPAPCWCRPILAVQGGVHLNYLFTLGLGLLFATTLLAGPRQRSAWRLVLAGALLGWIFLTRPYDAIVWGLVGSRSRARGAPASGGGSLIPAAGWAALGLAAPRRRHLAGEPRLTGSAPPSSRSPSPIRSTSSASATADSCPTSTRSSYGPRLGGGEHWAQHLLVPVLPRRAPTSAWSVAAAGAWIGRRQRRHRGCSSGSGSPSRSTYFAFFGTHISSLTARLSGPIYYIPAYAALCGLVAIAVVHLGRRRPGRGAGRSRPSLLAVTVAGERQPPVGEPRPQPCQPALGASPWRRSTGAALVVPSPPAYLLFVNPFGDNGADLEGRILFAADNGPELLDLRGRAPGAGAVPPAGRPPHRVPAPQRGPGDPEDHLDPDGDPSRTGPPARRRARGPPGRWPPRGGSRSTSSVVERGHAGRTTGEAIDIDLADLDLPDGLHTVEVKVGGRRPRRDGVHPPAVRTHVLRARRRRRRSSCSHRAPRRGSCRRRVLPRGVGGRAQRAGARASTQCSTAELTIAQGLPAVHGQVGGEQGQRDPRQRRDGRVRRDATTSTGAATATRPRGAGHRQPDDHRRARDHRGRRRGHEQHRHPDGHRQARRARCEVDPAGEPGATSAPSPAPRRLRSAAAPRTITARHEQHDRRADSGEGDPDEALGRPDDRRRERPRPRRA